MQKQFSIVFLLLNLVLSNHLVYSQSNTLYFMDGIHQSSQLNPAYQNPCNGYLALPVLSDINFTLANTGFDFNDFFYYGTGVQADSIYMDFDLLKSKLGKSNYLLTNVDVPILGFGFWIGNSYFTFSIYNKTKGRIAYSKGLFDIAGGNADNRGENNPIDIDGFGPNIMNYNEIALGLSKQITHRLIVGGKLKILMGNANIESATSNIKLYTGEDDFEPNMRLETDLVFRMSAPDFVKINYNLNLFNEQFLLEDVELDFDNFESGYVFSTKNMGLGVDVGASYLFNDRIRLYASVTDLGFINWRNNTKNYTQSGTFEFSGLSLDSVFTNSNYNEQDELVDSLKEFFAFSETDTKYSTWLPTNIYLGGTYELIPEINLGLLSKTFFYDKKLHQAITVSANFKPAKWFSGSLSYSIMNREYKNIGLGFSLKGGPVQFYFVTDYLNAAFWPKNTKTLGAQFGFNLYFGCGKRENYSMIKNKKPQKDIDFM